MSEEKPSIIVDGEHRHYHFISTEDSDESALKLLDIIEDKGLLPGTITRKDGKIDVFIKFTPSEELFHFYETHNCTACHFNNNSPLNILFNCNPSKCTVKRILENTKFHSEKHWENLCLKRYKYLVSRHS